MNDVRRLRGASPGPRLAPPLRRWLRIEVDERAVARMWRVIDERTARGEVEGGRRWLWVVPSVVALALVLLVGGKLVAPRFAAPPAPPAELLTAEGRRFESLEVGRDGEARAIELADGSRIEVAPGARVEGLASTASEFVVLVRQGRARFSVTRGGGRRWLIETRVARVEVVGTVLSVEVGEQAVHVQVERGAVLVRASQLTDGVRRLDAGQSVSLEAIERRSSERERAALPEVDAGKWERAPEADTAESLRVPKSSARGSRERREHRLSGEPELSPRARVPLADLWAEADRARQAGEPRRAAELLEQVVWDFPIDSVAALGAFKLGTLYLDQLAEPRRAARAFSGALARGLPHYLKEVAYRRWAESLRDAGDRAGVRRVIEEYAREYPDGAHLPALRAMLQPRP